MMIANKLKCPALRKDSGFIVNGAILKMEDSFRSHLTAMRELNEVAGSYDISILRTQLKKTMHGSFQMAHRHRLCGHTQPGSAE